MSSPAVSKSLVGKLFKHKKKAKGSNSPYARTRINTIRPREYIHVKMKKNETWKNEMKKSEKHMAYVILIRIKNYEQEDKSADYTSK
jgi:hypothetical protein